MGFAGELWWRVFLLLVAGLGFGLHCLPQILVMSVTFDKSYV